MKKIVIPALLALITTVTSAQSWGVRAGINIANVNIVSQGLTIKPNAVVGPNAGLFFTFKLAPLVHFQTELAYSGMGYKINTNGVSGTETTTFVTLPVLVKVKVPTTGLSFFAGPQAGILLSAKDESEGQTQDAKDNYKPVDVAGVGGIEYSFPLGLFVSARYQFSLINVANFSSSISSSVKNNCVSLLVGIKL